MTTTRTIGTIGRYEVSIATEPQPLSAYQRAQGKTAELGVWQGTARRIATEPACASALLTSEQCDDIRAMVAAA